MTITDPGSFQNSFKDLMKYFGTEKRPVDSKEFRDFWETLKPSEQLKLREMKLR